MRIADYQKSMIVFALTGLMLWWMTGKGSWAVWCCVLAVFGFVIPAAGRALHHGWMAMGRFIGRFSSPLILGVFYIVIFTPWSIVFRIFGVRDPLRMKRGHISCFRIVSKNYSRDDFEKTW